MKGLSRQEVYFMSDEQPFVIFDDSHEDDHSHNTPWLILVVDDDPDVHRATRFALKNIEIFGRRLETLHAYSAPETLKLVAEQPDIAVALLDVVMETDDAGLKLTAQLRHAGLRDTRIVLRTGYPGYAPELSVMTDYDIDDYRTKDELTRTRLLSVLTSAIRSYSHIHTLSRSRTGLELIIQGTREVFRRDSLKLFSEGLLLQLSALMSVEKSGFVCAETQKNGEPFEGRIVSACGSFANTPEDGARTDPLISKLLMAADQSMEPVFCDGYLIMQFHNDDGKRLWVVLESNRIPEEADRDLLRLFATNIAIGFENITLIETLDMQAHTDPIFGLPNLNACTRLLKQRLRSQTPGFLAMTTIGSFQTLFAQYGPQNAVALIREIFARMENYTTETHSVIMADGSFGVLADHCEHVTGAISLALSKPVTTGSLEVPLTPSTVLVDLSQRQEGPMSILRDASLALMHVSQTNPGCCEMYDEHLIRLLKRQRELTQALHRDVRQSTGFSVCMQPKNRLSDGAIVGAEALLRWKCHGENISPAEFIPLAEMAGLIQILTVFVIHEVAAWLKDQPAERMIPVSVNLSMADLNKPGLASSIIRTVSELGIDPAQMEFEVTEGVAMENAILAAAQVEQLAAAGFHISLDDFGTGYSSLGQFDRLPISTIKIDRAFVKDICSNRASLNLASVIISMTRTLNVSCVAEGVETEEQRQVLMRLGCNTGQGFLFSRPVPIEHFNELLRTASQEPPAEQPGRHERR